MSPASRNAGPFLGRYRLLGQLAAGGMAEVFLAEVAGPAGFQKSVVLKRIHPHLSSDPAFVEMFTNEARVAALLDHPNVVQIFELGEADGAFFIAMEHVDGANLRTLAERSLELQSPIPYAHAARILALACEGLGFAHDFEKDGVPLDLVHRDISPDNIMLSRTGAVKVMDFGVAKASTQRHKTKSGTIKGKLAYMPPEQLNNEVLDRRADLFALGVTLYELLAGLSPFDDSTEAKVITSILHHPPVPLRERRPDCPAALLAIIDRALQKDREERYPDCRTMQGDLERFLRRQPPVGPRELADLARELAPANPAPLVLPTAPMATAPDRSRSEPAQGSRKTFVAGLGVGALLVVATATVLFRQGLASPSQQPSTTAIAVPLGPDAAGRVAAMDSAPIVAAPEATAPAAQATRAHASPEKARVPPKMVEIPVPRDPDSEPSEPRGHASGPAKFKAADLNGDRKLSREELSVFPGLDFDACDTNHDGLVSVEEYVRARFGRRRRR